MNVKKIIKKLLGIKVSPMEVFGSARFQRINQKRLEHLASLGLEFAGLRVLEVGAGIGDHTKFFLDRGCQVVSTDARPEHLKAIRSRYPNIKVSHLNLDHPLASANIEETFDVVYCYGLLYHLKKPAEAIEFMSRLCKQVLLIETCVAFGDGESLHLAKESPDYPSASVSGYCCHPTRKWVYKRLRQHFEFVYLPTTQPNHEEFPIDWTLPPTESASIRATFVASRAPLDNPQLIESLPLKQNRH